MLRSLLIPAKLSSPVVSRTVDVDQERVLLQETGLLTAVPDLSRPCSDITVDPYFDSLR